MIFDQSSIFLGAVGITGGFDGARVRRAAGFAGFAAVLGAPARTGAVRFSEPVEGFACEPLIVFALFTADTASVFAGVELDIDLADTVGFVFGATCFICGLDAVDVVEFGRGWSAGRTAVFGAGLETLVFGLALIPTLALTACFVDGFDLACVVGLSLCVPRLVAVLFFAGLSSSTSAIAFNALIGARGSSKTERVTISTIFN